MSPRLIKLCEAARCRGRRGCRGCMRQSPRLDRAGQDCRYSVQPARISGSVRYSWGVGKGSILIPRDPVSSTCTYPVTCVGWPLRPLRPLLIATISHRHHRSLPSTTPPQHHATTKDRHPWPAPARGATHSRELKRNCMEWGLYSASGVARATRPSRSPDHCHHDTDSHRLRMSSSAARIGPRSARSSETL